MLTHPTLDQLAPARPYRHGQGLRRDSKPPAKPRRSPMPNGSACLLDREVSHRRDKRLCRPAALCPAAPSGRRRGRRLPRRARPRPRAVPEARRRRVDRRARQSDPVRADRRRQELAWLVPSATRPAATTARSSISASPSCSPISRWPAATAAMPASCASLGGVQLLILDDWGLEPLDAGARHDLLEILEERYGRALDHPHQPDPGRQMARRDRRPDLCRRHPRPPRPQRPPHRSRRRQPATRPAEPSQQRIDRHTRYRCQKPTASRRLARATSCRNTGRHHLGMTGRLRRNPQYPSRRA